MKTKQTLLFSIIACLLMIVSFPLPFWTVIMSAPTYPERNLSMRVYVNYFEGDIEEWNVVGNLVGVKVPPPIPDEVFTVVPILLAVIIFLTVIAIFKPQLLKIVSWGPFILMTGLAIWTQYSLYLFGHDLAEDRPLRYVEPFTPPVIGYKKIGNLLTYHLPHIGSFLLVTAGILLILAYRNYQKENLNAETPQPA